MPIKSRYVLRFSPLDGFQSKKKQVRFWGKMWCFAGVKSVFSLVFLTPKGTPAGDSAFVKPSRA